MTTARHNIVLLLLFSFVTIHASAQQNTVDAKKASVLADRLVSDVIISKERSTPSLIVFDAAKNRYAKGETSALLRKYLSLRPGYDDMLAKNQTSVYNQFEIPEFQQFFKGVKVEYSRYKALTNKNEVVMLAGSFYEIPASLNVQPAIGEQEALNIAKRQIGARHYVYEDLQLALQKATEPKLRKAILKELADVTPKGELTIVKDFTRSDVTDMRLAYKFNLYASEPLSRGYIFVDAQTGKILLYNAIIKHASVPTTVTTRYAGNRTINVKQVSGSDPNSGLPLTSSNAELLLPNQLTYILLDDTRGNGIETYDLNGVGGAPLSVGAIYAQGKSFTDNNNNWTLAEHKRGPGEQGVNEAENDDIAWDAHWGASLVYDYWKQKQGRLSYDGNNAAIKSYIHYGPAYDNAFWNGTAMTYGDGSGEAAGGFKALTSLDVCGHEIGHGVCTFTSDLVYEKESGALNEALSDIWAAAIENYAVRQIDPSLSTIYKPFFIGEQIAASPLRRMDAPKLSGNPDTYGGENWSNPDCTPTLANDQCGVHNNSGLLNKWFYLLTVGSGAGSGPDKNYVVPGADDGVNDNGAAYDVAGIGFDAAERITYLTELLLSSTATYAEFRDVSIGVAKAYSGDPCGPIVQSVTNAMYAIGVGAAFVAPCTTTFGFTFQPGTAINENNGQVGCTAQQVVQLPILLPANSTAAITFAGTATLNIDYVPSALSLNNTGGANKQDTLSLLVNNDGVIEGDETISITLNVAGLGANPSNNTYTITIKDDDVAPRIGSQAITLLNENFNSFAAGLTQPSTWTEVLEVPEVAGIDPQLTGKNQWGIFNGQLAIIPKTTLPGTVGGTYINTSLSQTRITPPIIDARGLSNVRLQFDYTVQGEVDPSGTDPEQFAKLDYLALAYSLDGVNYTELGPGYYFASALPTTATFNDTLPAFLNNQQFYLAFRWVNDPLIGGPVSVLVDNVIVQADPRKIESDLNNVSTEKMGPTQQVYFYSKEDGQIITRVDNQLATNYGCVTATIVRNGTGAFDLYNNGMVKVGDKVIAVSPADNNTIGSYNISLYLTEAEIAGIENATGKNRNSLTVFKTNAATPAEANEGNTVSSPATYTDIPGVGGIFTASFSSGFSSFAIGAVVNGPLPVTCIELKGTRAGKNILVSWKVAAEQQNKMFALERSLDGVTYTNIATIAADARNNGAYTYTDERSTQGNVYYRLKQVDKDGSSNYVCNTLAVKNNMQLAAIGNIYPNPTKGNAYVIVNSAERSRIQVQVMNAAGQQVNAYNENLNPGSNTINVRLPKMAPGTYMVRFTNVDGQVISTQSIVAK